MMERYDDELFGEDWVVLPCDACPICGENDQDNLVWDESGEVVECESCGARYNPGKGMYDRN